jgi:hypothetical protein
VGPSASAILFGRLTGWLDLDLGPELAATGHAALLDAYVAWANHGAAECG